MKKVKGKHIFAIILTMIGVAFTIYVTTPAAQTLKLSKAGEFVISKDTVTNTPKNGSTH